MLGARGEESFDAAAADVVDFGPAAKMGVTFVVGGGMGDEGRRGVGRLIVVLGGREKGLGRG